MQYSIVGRAVAYPLKALPRCRGRYASFSALRSYSIGEGSWTSSRQSIFCLGKRRWRPLSKGSLQGIRQSNIRCFASVHGDGIPPRIENTPNAASDAQRDWQVDESWGAEFSTIDSNELKKETIQQRVRRHIDALYPECARAGSIRSGERNGHSVDMVFDDDFTDVVHAVALTVDPPADANLTPGTWLNSQVMEETKRSLLLMVSKLATECNVKHAVCRVFVGGDAMWCRYQPENVEPTITYLNSEHSDEHKKLYDDASQAMREAGDAASVGTFRGHMFEKVLRGLYEKHPGCTVWDEGPLPLEVDGKPCAEPTRLFVARHFEVDPENHFQPEVDVEAKTHRVTMNMTDPRPTRPPRMLQSQDPKRHRGQIIGAAVLVATPLDDVWPKFGDYTKSATMAAAQIAAEELTKSWDQQGKLKHCHTSIWVGNDMLRFKYISKNLHTPIIPTQDPELEPQTPDAVAHGHPSLDPFFVKLEEQPKHKNVSSEIQWQAIRNWTRQRAEESPGFFRAIALHSTLDMARQFLKDNYPGCDVCDEGEMPAIINDEASWVHDTRLVVAKDPTKANNNVLAAMHLMPLPDPDKSWNEINDTYWLGTKQMIVAEYLLREQLKQKYKEGKLADDCLAMVLMASDMTMHKFVDGERFEDYPEERMKLFKMPGIDFESSS